MAAFIVKPLLYCYILLLVGYTPVDHSSVSRMSVGRRINFHKTEKSKASSNLHPIHVSTSNIEYNKQDGKLEVICTLFTDDFEDALAKQYHAKTDLTKQEMHAAMDELVKKYIAANLDIQADGHSVKLNYLGYEINREATDVYLESDALPPVKKVDVTVSLLYSLFDDQMNIVHVIVGGVRKSERVNYPDKKIEQVF